MKHRILTLIVVLVTLLGVAVAVAPSASAYCTGSPGCDSGWKSITVYYDWGHDNVNIDIHWTADAYNTRTFYFSGSSCTATTCSGFQYMALYYRVHPNGNWIQIQVYSPGPPYGSYSYKQFAGWPTPRDFVVAGHDQFGNTVNSPIVLN